jgi:hypothetical protein
MFIIDGVIVMAVLFGISYAFSPKVRQLVRIKGGNAVDSATSAIEKEHDAFEQLKKKMPLQRDMVTKVMAAANMAKGELDRRNAALEQVKSRFAQARKLGASDKALDELGSSFTTAKTAVDEQQKVLTEAQATAEEARHSLDQTITAMQKFGAKVENDKSKADLAAALRVTAEARQSAADISSALSAAGSASQAVDRQLEEARAANQLSKGTSTDQELQQLDEKAAAASGRAELEALLDGTK